GECEARRRGRGAAARRTHRAADRPPAGARAASGPDRSARRGPGRVGEGGGRVTGTLPRLVRLAGVGKRPVALTVLLGSLTILSGVGLMATAGYLISRAAERPAILSLTTAIVAVRFFGLARPIARYFERLSSHDLALRSLARVRRRFYERIEPLAPAHLEGYRQGEPPDRVGGGAAPRPELCLRAL